MEYNFKPGDILQLMKKTSLHDYGELCVVMSVDNWGIDVKFERRDGITCCQKEWFRKVDTDYLNFLKED